MKRLPIRPRFIRQLKEIQSNQCAICKISLDIAKFHLDHIIPLSKGGNDNFPNYQLLCFDCHKKKTEDEGGRFFYKEPDCIEKCKYCNKIIYGRTPKQVEHLMLVHLICRHRNEFKIVEIQKEEKHVD